MEERFQMKAFLSVLVFVFVSGCANLPPPNVDAPPTPVARPLAPGLSPVGKGHAQSSGVASVKLPDDLWEHIRKGFAIPDLESDLVQDRTQWYASKPDYIQRMSERSSKYLFYIVDELDQRNMPSELALLPFIESAFNPQAVSGARASGMWQFMPATGKSFDLKQNVFRDDRRDVQASTRAALDYLQRLYNMFGDWHLALAAYNWGEGNVNKAIARNQRAGLPTGYLDLNMPMETRLYVPKLQAMKNLVRDPQSFNLQLPNIPNHPYFQSVPLPRDMDVEVAAKLAEVSLEDFKALNPSATENERKDIEVKSEVGETTMDAKTERFLWIFAAVLVVVVLVVWQRDFSRDKVIDKIKNSVEFNGKEIEAVRENVKTGQDSWVKLFSAQQQTNNLLTQSLLQSKDEVGALDRKVSILGIKTETMEESVQTLDRTAQSMNELIRSFSSGEQSKTTIPNASSNAVVQNGPKSNVAAPRAATRSATILSPKEPKIGPIELVPTLAIDGVEVSELNAKPKKKYHFWNPFSWWGSEKPKMITRPDSES